MLPRVEERLIAAARALPSRALPHGEAAIVVCRAVSRGLLSRAPADPLRALWVTWRAQLGRVLRAAGGAVATRDDELLIGAFQDPGTALAAALSRRLAQRGVTAAAVAVHWGDTGCGLDGSAVTEAVELAVHAGADQVLVSAAARAELAVDAPLRALGALGTPPRPVFEALG